ncbi:MAG: GtrA family protein [Poseidonibacter sp.]|uniref:GtrA family protein n=1 Tax=Poseidonibacter sp. TaxID=2321188 RepID=UPI00359E767F
MKQFIKFGFIGGIGFLVDASILLFLVHKLNMDINISRVFSFLFAVLVTWLLNRKFTFSLNSKYKKRKEYIYYMSIQTIGALLNYTIFISLVYSYKVFQEYLILPLAIASIIVMFFNFFMIRNKIYN